MLLRSEVLDKMLADLRAIVDEAQLAPIVKYRITEAMDRPRRYARIEHALREAGEAIAGLRNLLK